MIETGNAVLARGRSAAQAIHDVLPNDVKSHCHVATRHHHLLDLIQAYAGFDLVIATQMHSCILALCAGVPVLPIAYEFKTNELFRLSAWRNMFRRWRTSTLKNFLGG